MSQDNQGWIERRNSSNIRAADSADSLALAHARELLESITTTADNARNLYVTYILLAVYVFLTVGSTNDEQLLRDSSIAVPFLSNINLPVSKFYQFVPWMFLFIHIDLLLLFKLLADKFHAFNKTLKPFLPAERGDFCQQLPGLPFVHWLAGERHDRFTNFMTGLIVWSTLLALPLLTLTALQIGFLPYHSDGITLAHRAALTLDALMLFLFWPHLANRPQCNAFSWWFPKLFALFVSLFVSEQEHRIEDSRCPREDVTEAASDHLVCGGICKWVSAILLGSLLFFSWAIAVLPGEKLSNLLSDADTVEAQDVSYNGPSIAVLIMETEAWFRHFLRSHLPLFHRNLDLHEKLLVANQPDLETIAKLQQVAPTLEKPNPALDKVSGLDLQKRDLRFANLAMSKQWRVDLRQARLEGADLNKARLQGADLREAHLWGADLKEAYLQGADLEGADLNNADLQGTDLREAHLWGADLKEAYLQGADLEGSQLMGVNLSSAQLQGADLREAQLQGADLREAQLQGAYLWGAQLQGADLRKAQLQGADLREVQLQGADLREAQLQGANLSGALVGSASFEGAAFTLSNLAKIT